MHRSDLGTTPTGPLRAVRVLLMVFCVLTAAGFTSLFVLAPRTSELFAWTIEPALTAAFLGAGYGAGLLLSVLCLRAHDWAAVRLPFATVTVFTWVTTAATLLHRDRLHMVSPGAGPVAEPAAWVWAVVYAVIPVAMTVVLARHPHPEPPTAHVRRRLPRLLAALLVGEGLVLGAIGLTLFAVPGSADQLWPWALTPFTARAVAAWLLAFALAAAGSIVIGDLRVLRTATVAYAAFGALQLLAVARFAGDVEWASPRAPLYVAFLVAVTATGAAGWMLGRTDDVRITVAARAT